MNPEHQIMLLREEATEPTEKVLENALGERLFGIYQKLTKAFAEEFNMEWQWRYYKDGKAWLCKVAHKKKTILWLSIWNDLIKTSFYFTEKNREDIMNLNIDKKFKDAFSETKPIGKLIPLIIDIKQHEDLNDLKTIVNQKITIQSK